MMFVWCNLSLLPCFTSAELTELMFLVRTYGIDRLRIPVLAEFTVFTVFTVITHFNFRYLRYLRTMISGIYGIYGIYGL